MERILLLGARRSCAAQRLMSVGRRDKRLGLHGNTCPGIAWALLLPKEFAAVIAAGGGPWIFVLLVMAYLFGFIPGTEGVGAAYRVRQA